MSTYLIGDIHGCYNELIAILKRINFSKNQDTLWLTGDLVSRGPSSLEVLRYIKSLGNSARIVLGNHDLQLLSIYAGVNKSTNSSLTSLLQASDVNKLMDWLRVQPLLQIDEEKKIVMVHAGISPYWNLKIAMDCARDVEAALSSKTYSIFLASMQGDMPNNWNPKLDGINRLRFIINVFTRMRYCYPNGQLDLSFKDIPERTPFPLKPWFSMPNHVIKNYSIVFGHWATLKGKGTPKGIYALDTGCCWGGQLTCLRWEDKTYFVYPCNG